MMMILLVIPALRQVGYLIGDSDGQIIDATILQSFRDFHTSGTVGGGFDHTNYLRLGPHEASEVIEIGRDGR